VLSEGEPYLTHLIFFVEGGPEVDLDRRDDPESSDLEVDDDSEGDDVLIGSEVNDLVLYRNTEKGESIRVHGESGEETEGVLVKLVNAVNTKWGVPTLCVKLLSDEL
jgi:hypothetical protein